jgi:hypothetical protein
VVLDKHGVFRVTEFGAAVMAQSKHLHWALGTLPSYLPCPPRATLPPRNYQPRPLQSFRTTLRFSHSDLMLRTRLHGPAASFSMTAIFFLFA